jgi:CRP-like cAMP-binding protein
MPKDRSMSRCSPESLESFRHSIPSQVHIPESEWAYVAPQLMERSFEKNAHLVNAGEIADHFFFIVKGLVRFFYATEDGKEFNKNFVMENGFAGSFHSLVLGGACGYFIQSLERTDTIVLPNRLLRDLYERHACWERLGRRNAENLALIKEAREREFLLDSLETRYRRFLVEFPGLEDRIPQYHIASFLGVTDVALSRIRRKLKQG